MLTKQLQILIETSLDSGKGFDEIRELLLKQGFVNSDISALFSEYNSGPVNTTSQQEDTSNISTHTKLPGLETESRDPGSKKDQKPETRNPTPEPIAEPQTQVQPKIFQSQQTINVGLGGMPELENLSAQAYNQEKGKSIIPRMITFIVVLVIIGGFFYWYLFLFNNSFESERDGDVVEEESVPAELFDPGTIDPFTGEKFE